MDAENTIHILAKAPELEVQSVKNVFGLKIHRRSTKTKSHHSQTLALVMRKSNQYLDLPAKKKENKKLEKQFCLVGLQGLKVVQCLLLVSI